MPRLKNVRLECPSTYGSSSLPEPSMRACLQRVARAQVTVGEEIVGQIDCGMLVLLGVVQGDDEADARQLAQKSSRCGFLTTRRAK